MRSAAFGLLVILSGLVPLGMQGQAAAAKSETFEVASIKKSPPDRQLSSGYLPGGRFLMSAQTVEDMVGYAFDSKYGTLSGGPGWVRSERFDIEAKVNDAEAAELDKMPWKQRSIRTRQMMLALLEDRFQLKVRQEEKVLPIYALTVAKGGPKAGLKTADPSLPPGPSYRVDTNGWSVTKINMDDLADELTFQSDVMRIVANETGLTGDYRFELLRPQGEEARSTLRTLLEDQLGLKLVVRKEPVPTVVIEEAQQPSAN